ncbi:hypothetical protein, partial [Enterococcus faecium]|uniref:hypothetical protein n=1 Tax=Enterococcus faecium TaxID=1352 RepID=UPI0023B22A3A
KIKESCLYPEINTTDKYMSKLIVVANALIINNSEKIISVNIPSLWALFFAIAFTLYVGIPKEASIVKIGHKILY